MKSIISTIFIFILQLSLFSQEVRIKPKWNVGDSRLVKTIASTLVIADNDTVMNFSAESNYLIKVDEKGPDFYVISYSNSQIDDIDVELFGIDPLDEFEPFAVMMNAMIKITEKVMNSIPLSYKISLIGEAIEVSNFESTFEAFHDSLFVGIQEMEQFIKENFDDTFSLNLDPDIFKASMASKKEDFREQLLNIVNYLNQAYYSVVYEESKEVLHMAIIKEYDVYEYGNVEIEGILTSEILQNSSESFTIKISTEYDQESLELAMKNSYDQEISNLQIIEDWMIVEFDPENYWIRQMDTYQKIVCNEMEIISVEKAKLTK